MSLVGAILTASPAAQAQTHEPQPAAGDPGQYPSLRISGFADINFSETQRAEGPRGFSLGQFTLHLASPLSPRVTFFGELSFTARTDGGTGTPAATGFNAEVERLILRFDQSDRLKVSFGRYHTPINWWNTAYHHGSWLQTSISRPEMIQFGGRLLPVHFIGGLLEGSIPAAGWNLNYKAGIGNGRALVISRGGDAGDVNDSRAYIVNAFSKPDRAFGLEFGGSLYIDTVTLSDSPAFAERIVAGHVIWHKEKPEIMAEVAGVRHQEVGSEAITWSQASYVQIGYRLPMFNEALKPFYRFEHIDVDGADAVFTSVRSLTSSTLGLRHDVSPHAALKFEYRTWVRPVTPRDHGGFFQVCFTF